MPIADLRQVEQEIDNAFASNDLAKVPFTQSAWTLLSQAEDHHFKIAVMDPLPDPQAAIYVDGLINALTYPLRVLHRIAPRTSTNLNRQFIDEHYALALKWINDAEDYTHFCSIFPLFHAGEISLDVDGDKLEPSDWSSENLSYEVYDRFVAKRHPNKEKKLDASPVISALRARIRTNGGMYSVDFSHDLLSQLHYHLGPAFLGRHVLPANWGFSAFSLEQYRRVFVCLQVMAEAWFTARYIVASTGVRGMAYESSVWTPRRSTLLTTLSRYTRVPVIIVEQILRYLTFGEVGIRNPDIAIQPIVDLGNERLAISPFVITQVHAERNLCVLLNQVPADQRYYARLVNEKEIQLRRESIDSLRPLGYDCRNGKLDQTDVDLAIIDHESRSCLCVELKWFIEPAEIREVLMRSKELQQGVSQANVLHELFHAGDRQLLSLLGIDASYDFLAMVGSVNFIGRPGIQDPRVPITKLWHLIARIEETGSLSATLEWLRARRYLPVKDLDYKVIEVPIECGKWKSRWYGIKYA